MKKWTLTLIVILTYLLQTSVIPEFSINGIYPNLFLVVTCGLSFLFGSTIGAVNGFCLGLLNDFSQGRCVGLYAFLSMYIGMILGQFNKRFFKDNYVVAIIFIGFATVFYEVVVYLFSMFAYSQEFSLLALVGKSLMIAFMNMIASVIVYPILLKIHIGIEVDRNIFGR
ncbi:MAG: rod shape-determining protein MreD [Clostridia bacterium]|nr:rod shape-determining protein MreD [Clostridia bacterium]